MQDISSNRYHVKGSTEPCYHGAEPPVNYTVWQSGHQCDYSCNLGLTAITTTDKRY